MNEKEVLFIVQGMLRTLVRDKKYFYHSSVGPTYCHLTEDGRRVLMETMELVAPKLYEAMHQEDVERSKELIMKELTNQ